MHTHGFPCGGYQLYTTTYMRYDISQHPQHNAPAQAYNFRRLRASSATQNMQNMTYSFSTMRTYTRMRHADGFGSSQRIDFGVQCDWPPMTSKWGVDKCDDKHRSCVCAVIRYNLRLKP